MTDPKVSEGMRELFKAAINEAFGNGNAFAFPSEPIAPECVAGDALLSAIAALEARADTAESERDKWKRVAVAVEAMTSFHNQTIANAIAALGPAWPEAVK